LHRTLDMSAQNIPGIALRLAISSREESAVLSVLVAAPKSIFYKETNSKYKWGQELALHSEIADIVENKVKYGYNKNGENILMLLFNADRSIAKLDFEGESLLMFAIKWNLSKEFVEVLIEEYPEALKKRDKRGNTCLCNTILYGSTEEMVLNIIRKNEGDVRVKCKLHGDLVIMKEVKNMCRINVIKELLRVCRGSTEIQNKEGLLPLHVALDRGHGLLCLFVASCKAACSSSISLLMKESGISSKCECKGYFPLHIALYSRCSVEVVKMIIEKNKNCINSIDKNTNNALQVAVKNLDKSTDCKNFHIILEANKFAVYYRDVKGLRAIDYLSENDKFKLAPILKQITELPPLRYINVQTSKKQRNT